MTGTVQVSSNLLLALLIAERCREEGKTAKLSGNTAASCPYAEELERAAWLDGWSRA